MRHAIKDHAGADDGRIGAEPRVPQGIAKNGDSTVPWLCVLHLEDSAQTRLNRHRGKKFRGDVQSVDPVSLIADPKVEAALGHRAQAGENAAIFPVGVVGHGCRKVVPVTLGILGPHQHYPAGVGNGQRSERRMDDAVDGRVGPDAERQSQHHYNRESEIFAQHARAVT